MTNIASAERAALADLMERLGPDAPTLCAGWTTRDLAAHIVVRATRTDAAAGILIPGLAGHTKRVQDQVASQPWDVLLTKVRRKPWWSTVGDETINRMEYFVHHEDVRRAQDGWIARELPAEWSEALWARVKPLARMMLRRVPAVVTVTAPNLRSATAGADAGGADRPRVTITAPAGELLMFLTGRQDHADVDITGPDDIIEKLRTGRYRL